MFNLAQAEQALQKQAPQIAILDVNISGELSFPVADLLNERNIPIVFVTGYFRITGSRLLVVFRTTPDRRPSAQADVPSILSNRSGHAVTNNFFSYRKETGDK